MSGLIYTSQYQNLHMDRANPESMKTINITVNTNFQPNHAEVRAYRYRHGYDYVPQFWGLWDMQLNSAFGGGRVRSYGVPRYQTGLGPTISVRYQVTGEWVNVYFRYEDPRPSPGRINTRGITIRLTGYLFANDLQPQDYTT